ncbi:MAG: glycosyltransferase [Planctomycetota bacterium]|nr:glycosyltransferase [Planctomycetota bacterium]
MKVLFLARPEKHPATRYRVLQFLPLLRERGIEAAFEPFPETKTGFGWLRLMREKGSQDVLVIQKKRLGRFALWAIRRRCGRLLYDLDDAVMFNSTRHATPDNPRRMAAFKRMVESVDGVIVGNRYLEAIVREFNQHLWVVPTSIDTGKYRPRAAYDLRAGTGGTPVPHGAPPSVIPAKAGIQTPVLAGAVLGWIGGRKSLSLLKPLLPVLEKLAKSFTGLTLKIIGAPSAEGELPAQGPLRIVCKPWSEAEEAADVASFDLGLAPLPDHPWAAGKCATKLLQCMAAGVPCVASPVGAQKEIVTDGVDGYLASNDAEWHEKLAALIKAAALREWLGKAGRRRVEEQYSVAVNAPRLATILHSAGKRGPW